MITFCGIGVVIMVKPGSVRQPERKHLYSGEEDAG